MADFVKQKDIGIGPETYSVLAMMAQNIRSAKRIAERFQNAATFAYDEATRDTDSLFDDPVPRASRQQVLEKINANTATPALMPTAT